MATKTLYHLSEDKIERAVEREMNILDRLLMRGVLSQDDYEQEVRELDAWARAEYEYNRNRA